MKLNKLKLLLIVLIMFSFTFLLSIGKTKAIYRETKSTTLSLTVVSSSSCTVTFNSNGGTSIASRTVEPNNQVGVLPIPTKANSNFAGWYDENNQRVRHTTVITRDTVLHAEWTNIVCKMVTDENKLHTEVCLSGGCRVNNNAGFAVNDVITYGDVGDGVPVSGDAYDCDVDANGTFDDTESDNKTYMERFYFIREIVNTNSENSAALVYSTSFDANGRNNRVTDKNDGSTHYTLAETYLPTTTTPTIATAWDNPLLVDLDGNGKVSRFISMDDLESVCGPVSLSNTNYFAVCQKWFWFENSRFQNANVGRAGIWMEYETGDTKYHRIHTQSFDVMEVEETSENMARPVIEIPMSALEGYYDEDRFTVSFNTYQGDTNIPENRLKYRGEALGTLPTVTRENFEFDGWYTDSNYQNIANPTALVSGNMTLYAKWEAEQGITVTLHLDGGTITGVTSPISLDSGDLLDNLPDPEKEGYNFLGWYTDSTFETPFDDTQPITANLDLYAKWEEVQTVTVTLYLDGGTITGVTSPISLDSGDLLDNLPDPEKEGFNFLGWYTDSTFDTPFDDTVPITSNLDLYAKWEVDNYVAEVNGTKYTTLAEAITKVPTGKIKTTVKILKDITLDTYVSIPNTKWVELDLQNYTIDTSTTDLIRNAGYLDIINGTLISTANNTTNNNYPGYIIYNANNAELNISGGLLKFNNTASKEAKVIKNFGKVTITGGRLECNAEAAAIDHMGGTITMTGGEIIATGTTKGQAIYLTNSASLNISGDAYLSNVSTVNSNDQRAAVDNTGSGTVTITGGTIISEGLYAVNNRGSGTTIIGINDANGNVVDTTTPILKGNTHAINRAGGTFNVYDGKYLGQTGAANGTITKPANYDFVQNGTDGSHKVYYLANSSGGPYTVTFDADNGDTIPAITGLNSLDTVGSSMPNNPTKTNYIFEKWFVYKEDNSAVAYYGEFTSTTPVTDNITVMAKWKPAIGTATITPSSLTLLEGDTATITVTGPSEMESYTFASSNTNIATVDANGVVTAVAEGTATISIIGTESNDSQTVSVTVNGIVYRTVTFYDELNGNVIKTTQVVDGTQIGAAGMPASNPTKTNYVFDNWYVNGNTSTPAFNSTATITADTVVIANWFEAVSYATLVINPDPMEIYIGDTGTIALNPTVSGETVETYTCTSSDDSIATVSNCTVTGVGEGTTTITISGNDPLNTKTVTVTVSKLIIYRTVTFYDELNGNIIKTTQVEDGTQIGAAGMPASNPTKNNYVFDNWYVNGNTSTPAFNSTATITADTIVIANWFETVDYATLVATPSPMNLYLNETGTIVLNPTVSGETVESYTCTSSDDTVATVSNCTVTAVGIGSATITISGSDPLNPKTVNVTVDTRKYTVIFNKNNGDQDEIITLNNVVEGTILSTIVPSDPTKTNEIFDNWFIVDNGTWTNDYIDTSIEVTNNLEYKAGFYSSDDVASIGHNYYATLADAFTAINNNVVSSHNVKILKDFTVPTTSGQNRPTINSKKEAVIDGNNHTITCGNENIIYNNGGTVSISKITLTCNASKVAPLNNNGTMTVIDSTVSMTLTGVNGRAAIYNTGTLYIEGNSNLSTVAKERSTVQNVSSNHKIYIYGGTITQGASDATKPAVEVVSGSSATITGGTIISTHQHAITNAGTLVIGEKNNQYSTTSIVIQGEQYGISSTADYSLYDGLIKGKTDNQAVNDFTKIKHIEDNMEDVKGTDGDYFTLYYVAASATPTPTPTATPTPTPTPTPSVTHTITFESIGGTVSPASVDITDGDAITNSDLPTATWGDKTLAGWYLDEDYTNQVVVGTTVPTEDTTYYAKWTYTPANSKVTYNSTNSAMATYFSNINTWKDLPQADFEAAMMANFTDSNNNCSSCQEENGCDSPGPGTRCDKPKSYNTNTNSALKVYLYDESTHTILDEISYANASNGTISNLIPGQAYYWEESTNSSVNGLIEFTTPRRNLDVGNVRNVRDLGGLSVSYTENNVQKTGTIKYGRLIRGAHLTSDQADATALVNLGMTREIDLRPNSDGSSQARLPLLDNGNGGTDITITNYLINRTSFTYSYTHNNISYTEVAANTTNASNLKSAMKSIMQYIIDGDNIYFHCTIGTDRTGTIAYFLEGLLGVSEEDRVRDYELTYFYGLTNRTRYHDDLNSTTIYPRFKFMHTAYPTNQNIYDWFVYGDNASQLQEDNQLIADFRAAMIDSN